MSQRGPLPPDAIRVTQNAAIWDVLALLRGGHGVHASTRGPYAVAYYLRLHLLSSASPDQQELVYALDLS